VVAVAPEGVAGDWPDGAVAQSEFPGPATEKGKPVSASVLSVRLVAGGRSLAVTHWADGTRAETCKTFAGQQVGAVVFAEILGGIGAAAKPGTLRGLLRSGPGFAADPLSPSLPVPAAFGFDARGAWEAVQSGISLNELGLPVAVSPAVEALAPLGLEHARPATVPPRTLRYAIWPGLLPPALARLAVGAADVPDGLVLRRFRTHTGADKYYKKFFPAIEE
jgi:CRISPR-associated protein Csb3